MATKAKAKSAASRFASATVIPKSANSQIRVVASEYEGHTRLDVREWRLFGDKNEFKPTKNGVTIPLAQMELFLSACQKHALELPRRVIDMDNCTAWTIATKVENVQFKKDSDRVYKSEEEALAKTPPDGYKLFKVRVEKGVIVSHVKTHFRDDDKWKKQAVKAETVEPVKRIAVKAKTKR